MRDLLVVVLLFFFVNSYGQDFTDLVKEKEQSIVLIKTFDKDGLPLKQGTGFFIDSSGKLITNYHIFQNAYGASVYTYDHNEYFIDQLLSSSKVKDIAVFTIKNPLKKEFKFNTIAKEKPQKGEDIFIIGNPQGLENSISRGIISGIHNVDKYGTFYQITAAISPGSSGSPIYNMKGNVIGLASYQLEEGQNINFATDIISLNELKNNDGLLLPINIKKKLPKDKSSAINLLDSLQSNHDSLTILFLNKFISEYPSSFEGYLMRGNIYASFYTWKFCKIIDTLCNNKYIMLAEKDFEKAIDLAPRNPKVYLVIANSKYGCYNYLKRAIIDNWSLTGILKDINSCKQFDESYEKFSRLSLTATVQEELNNYEEELEIYNEMIRIQPNNDNPYCWRGLLKYYHFNDVQGSLKDLDRAIELKPFCNYISWKANIEYEINDYSSALKDLRKLLNSCSESIYKNHDTYYKISSILFQINGDKNEALNAINKSITLRKSYDFYPLNKDDSKYFLLRCYIYQNLELYKNALIDINKAFELTPNEEIPIY